MGSVTSPNIAISGFFDLFIYDFDKWREKSEIKNYIRTSTLYVKWKYDMGIGHIN